MHTLRHSFPLIALTAITWTATAGAQPLDFVTVGAAGNRSTIPSEVPGRPEWQAGSVGYEYRMMRTELTVAQHFEFAQAYLQFNPQAVHDPGLRGPSLVRTATDELIMLPETTHWPSEMSWHMAARLCNWYHNGKVREAWAFESGAYDTTTFVQLPNGSRLDQLTRSPGARFWIPSIDEWIKAAYFDPNRYGPGLEGYWSQPNASNEVLISDYPQNGGQTNAGFGVDRLQMDVGQYPQVQSPWGLLDVSGGKIEHFEDAAPNRNRLYGGTNQGFSTHFLFDRLDNVVWGSFAPDTSVNGLRLASQVPSPSTLVVFVAVCTTCFSRRRHQCSSRMRLL